MPSRLGVIKTYKLFINGTFPRTESGRSMIVLDHNGEVLAHLCHASRKDLRDAVEAARTAQPKWADATPYNRGQVLYRMAEMLEGKREEFVGAIKASRHQGIEASRNQGTVRGGRASRPPLSANREVDAAIDRLVCFAGWADKHQQVLGCHNPVAGPYYNFTVPEPTGVVACMIPPRHAPPLLGLVTLLAPPLCAGNAVVVIAHETHPIPAAIFGEVCATSDVPAGVVNILTTKRGELIEPIAMHREINAVAAANVSTDEKRALQLGAAENVKRIHIADYDDADWLDADVCESPWAIEPFIEFKTIWHPSGR